MKTKPEKTCPFCGRDPEVTSRKTNPVIDVRKFVSFISCACGGCSSHAHISGYGNTPEEALNQAIEKWDTRV
jgi:hypothetical protein